MYPIDLDQPVLADVLRERRTTTAVAVGGISLGLAFSLGLPAYFYLHNGPAFLDLIGTAFLGPAIAAMAQHSAKNAGHPVIAELLGYFGLALASPGLILRSSASTIPAVGLAGLYEDQGRNNLALKLLSLTKEKAGASIADAVSATGYMQILYNAGKYDEAFALSAKLLQTTSDLQNELNDKNRQILCMVRPAIITNLVATGHFEEARSIWQRTKSLAEFGETPALVSFVFNQMSCAAIRVKDYEEGLRFATLARDSFSKHGSNSRFIAGNIAINFANCFLAQSDLAKAEEEAITAHNEWRSFLSPTAGAMWELYALFGEIEMRKGNVLAASRYFERAIDVTRHRIAPLYPGILPTLEHQMQCLHELGRTNEAGALQNEVNEIEDFHHIAACKNRPLYEYASEPESASSITDDDRPEPTVEELAKDAASRQTNSALRSLLVWLSMPALLMGSPQIISGGLLAYAIVLAMIVFVPSQLVKIFQINWIKSLCRRLSDARSSEVSLLFKRTGKFQVSYTATVQQSCGSLSSGSVFHFNILPSVPGTDLFGNQKTTGRVFLDEHDKPFLVAVGRRAFYIDHGWFAGITPKWKPVLSITKSVASYSGLMALFIGMSSAGLLTPPKEVPEGKSQSDYYNLGIQYKTVGWTEQSRTALEKAIASGHGNAVAVKAKRYLETKLPRYPQPVDAVAMNINGYNADGPLSQGEAEKIWLECIDKYPTFEWSYSNLGNLYVSQGKYKEGEGLLNKALEINPSYVNALLHLADSKRKQRDFPSARKYINKALSLDPDDDGARIMSLLPDI